MSEELFPDETTEYEYDEEDNDDRGLNDQLSKLLKSLKQKFSKKDNEEENDEEKDKDKQIFSDRDGDEDKTKLEKMDRTSWLIVSVEIFLLLYLILAISGLAPFF